MQVLPAMLSTVNGIGAELSLYTYTEQIHNASQSVMKLNRVSHFVPEATLKPKR